VRTSGSGDIFNNYVSLCIEEGWRGSGLAIMWEEAVSDEWRRGSMRFYNGFWGLPVMDDLRI
jgi:hypothetical protein